MRTLSLRFNTSCGKVSSHSRLSPSREPIGHVVDEELAGRLAVLVLRHRQHQMEAQDAAERPAVARHVLARRNEGERAGNHLRHVLQNGGDGRALRELVGKVDAIGLHDESRQSRPSLAEISACAGMMSWKRGTCGRLAAMASASPRMSVQLCVKRRALGKIAVGVENRRRVDAAVVDRADDDRRRGRRAARKTPRGPRHSRCRK